MALSTSTINETWSVVESVVWSSPLDVVTSVFVTVPSPTTRGNAVVHYVISRIQDIFCSQPLESVVAS